MTIGKLTNPATGATSRMNLKFGLSKSVTLIAFDASYEQQCIAVRPGGHDRLCGKISAGTISVLDEDGLP